MKIELASSYIRAHKKIVKKNRKVAKKIKNKLKLFIENPKHPSLRLHKLTGTQYQDWSLSI